MFYKDRTNSIKEIKENAGEVPVLANTGVTSGTVEDILKEIDGAIIVTAFKIDKITWNPVSQERANKSMKKISSLEKNLKKQKFIIANYLFVINAYSRAY